MNARRWKKSRALRGDGSERSASLRAPRMRICLVYDCLFPYTVGGAERWYRNLGERLARGRPRGHLPDAAPVGARRERAEVAGRARRRGRARAWRSTPAAGRRRILPPLVFGRACCGTCCATAAATTWSTPPRSPTSRCSPPRPLRRLRPLSASWSTGTRSGAATTGASTSGRWAARIGHAVQALCLRVPQRAFCFSRLHARRLREGGLRGEVTVLEGEYAGALEPPQPDARRSRWWCSPAATSPRSACPRSSRRSAALRRTAPDAALRDLRRRPRARRVPERGRELGLGDAVVGARASSTPPRSRRRCAGRCAWCCPRGARATGWS